MIPVGENLPYSWQWKKLGQMCDFLDSRRIPLNNEDRENRIRGKNISELYPYYGANGQVGWIDSYIFDEPLILLAEDGGHFGSPDRPIAYAIDGKTWVNNHAHVLRPKNGEINFHYCLYALMFRPDVEQLISGTTRGKLNQEAAAKIPIPLPPLDEQKRIAAIIEEADHARRSRGFTQSLSDTFLQETFVDMFGDPVTNPMGWETTSLSKMGKLDRGRSKHRPRNAPFLLGGPYPLIQTGDIANSDRYIREFHQTYSELGLKQSRMWPAGTMCITIAANIAKTAILTFDACFPDSVVGFTSKQEFDTEYVLQWFTFVQKNLEQIAPESAQKNINLEILRGLDIPLPPEKMRLAFAEIVWSYEQSTTQQKESARQAEHLFQTLLHRAFRGEL